MDGVVLWGTGKWANIIFSLLEENNYQIEDVCDSSILKTGQNYNGFTVKLPNEIKDIETKKWIIALQDDCYRIIDELKQRGVQRDRVWSVSEAVIHLTRYSYTSLSTRMSTIERKYTYVFDCPAGLGIGGIERWSIDSQGILQSLQQKACIVSTDFSYLENRYSKSTILKIMELLLDRIPCVVVASDVTPIFIAAVCLRKILKDKVILISAVHGSRENLYRKQKDIEGYVDYILATSKVIYDNLVDFGIQKEKIFKMQMGIKISQFEKRYSLPNEPIRIGYVGRLVRYAKRADLLIKTIEELEQMNIEYVFSIVGEGEYKKKIQDFINDKNLHNKVILYGALTHEEVMEFWDNIDVAVNVSDNEGVCISNVEAMSRKVVPIITNTSAADIINQKNGMVVNVGDYVDMAQKINLLSHKKNLLSRYGNNAYITIKKDFSIEKAFESWKKVIDAVCQKYGDAI